MPVIKFSVGRMEIARENTAEIAEKLDRVIRSVEILDSAYEEKFGRTILDVDRYLAKAYDLIGRCLLWMTLTEQDFKSIDEQVSYGWTFEGVTRDGTALEDLMGEQEEKEEESPWYAGYTIKKNSIDPGYNKKWDGFTGEEIPVEPNKVESKITLGEYKKSKKAEISAYEDELLKINKDGREVIVDGALFQTMASCEAAAGVYIKDGKTVAGVRAAASFSVSAMSFNAQGKYGDDDLNIHFNGSLELDKLVGSVEAELSTAGVKLAGEAGIYVVDASIAGGVTVAGIDATLEASLTVGIGANFDFEVSRDGKMKFEIGAAVGLGLDLSLEVDASGAIEAIGDFADDYKDHYEDGLEILEERFDRYCEYYIAGLDVIGDYIFD